MREALARSKKAKPERLLAHMSSLEMQKALEALGDPAEGNKAALAERLLTYRGVAGAGDEPVVPPARDRAPSPDYGGAAKQAQAPLPTAAGGTAQYEHGDRAIQRPEAGVQDQFQAKKPPRTYRYDSSLDPALSWDEQRERDLGEWLLGLIVRATKEGERGVFAEPQEWKGGGVRVTSLADAARLLQDISKPFLNWAGKAERHEIRVPSVPLFVHERHSTKAILDGIRHRKARGQSLDLFGDSQIDIRENLEAYEHQGPWRNRMILGDSLSVMNSLLEFEGMAGQVQMIYIDPPYGVKFGSNFQPFVRAPKVVHGDDEEMTREPEMVRAYRDTWELGTHSYLAYLRDRLAVARELLSDSGSVFVQISEDNHHHVHELLDEIFGAEQYVTSIVFAKTTSSTSNLLSSVFDTLLWYAKNKGRLKYRGLFGAKVRGQQGATGYTRVRTKDGSIHPASEFEDATGELDLPVGAELIALDNITSQSPGSRYDVQFAGKNYRPEPGYWKTDEARMKVLLSKGRIASTQNKLAFVRRFNDFPLYPISNIWTDTVGQNQFGGSKMYVVQTALTAVRRCMAMCSDPGDLVLDPTCGSGTTAYVAEQWGRRWITIDTSRVPLALARQRLLTATFPYYELKSPQSGPGGGFVYKRKQNRKGEEIGGLVPHITLKSIANDEPPAMEVLVDRPEEVPNVTRVTGPFVVEATIAPVQPLGEAEGDGRGEADPATHIERMTEVLRQSKTLRLPGNRELVLSGVRRTVDAEFLHAEAKECVFQAIVDGHFR
ncbi:MAG: site-specific DNA-methyltransferase [Burkholderiales bacterium]|nr:site-specific DNA-methyltransferase [Burkholderiales bacterium]